MNQPRRFTKQEEVGEPASAALARPPSAAHARPEQTHADAGSILLDLAASGTRRPIRHVCEP
eukprot:4006876-Amphidinium_carterae.1